LRLIDKFEGRVLAALGEMALSAELDQMDYEIFPLFYPVANPDGTTALGVGMQFAMSTGVPSGDHVLTVAVCQDPYLDDLELKNFVCSVLDDVRRQRDLLTPSLNGGAVLLGGRS
jgi:hypothetical protein